MTTDRFDRASLDDLYRRVEAIIERLEKIEAFLSKLPYQWDLDKEDVVVQDGW